MTDLTEQILARQAQLFRNARVLIGVPSLGSWVDSFGLCLVDMIAKVANDRSLGLLQVTKVRGSILPKSRRYVVEEALKSNMTHVLFIDSDMYFPPFTLYQLLSYDKEFVAANCATKTLPANPTARAKSAIDRGGDLIYTTDKSHGLERVWRIGTGVALIRTSVFRKIPQPWFKVEWDAEEGIEIGEDWFLCQRCDEYNIPIYIDHTISQCIGHIGDFIHSHADVEVPEVILEEAS